MVQLREQFSFEFYVPVQADVILHLRESPTENRLDLKALAEAEKLLFIIDVEGNHLQFSCGFLLHHYIINVFFRNKWTINES